MSDEHLQTNDEQPLKINVSADNNIDISPWIVSNSNYPIQYTLNVDMAENTMLKKAKEMKLLIEELKFLEDFLADLGDENEDI